MGDRLGIRDVVDIIFWELSLRKPPIVLVNKFPLTLQLVPRGLTARISGFHPGGPGSTPGVGKFFIHILSIGESDSDQKKQFRYRELNPGHLGESQVS